MNNLYNHYIDHLEKVILPFWERALDLKYGGVYTCFDNTGSKLVSKNKYTWSQGRFVWIWTRLSRLLKKSDYLEQAKKTIDFLWDHSILENGNCAFLLSESGEVIERDNSFYADCFVVLGFTEYARTTKDYQVLENALILYDRILDRIKKGTIRSEPYPIPNGFKAHGVPMILLNVSQELGEALEFLGHVRAEEVNQVSYRLADEIMKDFYFDDFHIAEMIPANKQVNTDLLLCRHINPGHTLEDMWFVMTTARKFNNSDWIDRAVLAIKKAVELGWDQEFGGLFRYVDMEGGQPKGVFEDDPYQRLVLDTWDTKLWWPHSEALYATLFAFQLTGDEYLKNLYLKIHEYTFRTFPNPDLNIGEWIQIRDRMGNPLEKLVALPVKDPYHIIRNMILIIELLGKSEELRSV